MVFVYVLTQSRITTGYLRNIAAILPNARIFMKSSSRKISWLSASCQSWNVHHGFQSCEPGTSTVSQNIYWSPCLSMFINHPPFNVKTGSYMQSVWDSVHTYLFSFSNAIFFSVFKNISVHTITYKRFENAYSLLRLESYLPKHLYLLVKPEIFKVLFVFVSCQDVSDCPSRLGVKVTW